MKEQQEIAKKQREDIEQAQKEQQKLQTELEAKNIDIESIQLELELLKEEKEELLVTNQVWTYNRNVDYRDFITVDPNVRGGKACIRGMRVTVSDVLDLLAVQMDPSYVTSELPYVTEDDVRACVAYVADRERKIHSQVA